MQKEERETVQTVEGNGANSSTYDKDSVRKGIHTDDDKQLKDRAVALDQHKWVTN